MPWLISLALAAVGFAGATLRRSFSGGAVATAGRVVPALAGAGAGSAIGSRLFGGLGDEVIARRRRRKALTETDLRLALTIASAISKKAAENFILMRVRR